ncbi:MAG: hypothetical protein ACYDBB_20965 [Armatimonadota bacterium]
MASRFGLLAAPARSYDPQVYPYHDEQDILLYQVVRQPGKRFIQRCPDGQGGWCYKMEGITRVPYHLPELLAADSAAVVYIVEGEKDVETLAHTGLVATTNPGGAGKWRQGYAKYLKDRKIAILPDNDTPGKRHAEKVAISILPVAEWVKVVTLPDLPEKGDVTDWLNAGHTTKELAALVEETPSWEPTQQEESSNAAVDDNNAARESLAHSLVTMVFREGVELFRDERREPQLSIPDGEGRQIMPVEGRSFDLWLRKIAWEQKRLAVNSEAIATAKKTLAGIATGDKYEERPLHIRCARPLSNGPIYLDLDGRRTVQVTAEGWDILPHPPILFRTFPHQRRLPDPSKNGNPRAVLQFVNLHDADAELLFLTYLVAALVPNIPIPVLIVHGMQGAAKTTLFKIVKRLLDPTTPEVGSIRDPADFPLMAWQNRVLLFDNLTRLGDELSDCFCRAVSGEGSFKRTLFTDTDATFFEYRCVLGINGINVVADRSDLLDRALILELNPISPEHRREEREFWRAFDDARPSILGGLLDALVVALRIEGTLKFSSLPRMADYTRIAAAAAEALGWSQNAFLAAYNRNIGRQNETALEASLVGQAVIALMQEHTQWPGTISSLLDHLEQVAEGMKIDTRCKAWPKNPTWLARRLHEVQPNLLAMGIEVLLSRGATGRTVTLRKLGDSSVNGVNSVNGEPK